MRKESAFILLSVLLTINCLAQTEQSFSKHIQELCSEKMHGRGTEFKGDGIAAKYIMNQFKGFGLKPYKGSHFQSFKYDANSFEGAYSLKFNDRELKVGDDFLAHAASKPGKGSYKTCRITEEKWKDEKFRAKFLKKPCVNRVLIVDHALNDPKTKDYFKLKLHKLQASAVIDVIDNEPIANEFSAQTMAPTFQVSKTKLATFGEINKVTYHLDATFKEDYPSQNVYGIVRGKKDPASFIIVSAHYDHIGHLGKEIMIEGANDNASGVAMLLSMAEHFGKPENQPDKSILFIAFAAEEIGLLGSKHYVEHPLIDLKKTNFVLNLDLMGSGSEGITVVNGRELQLEYTLLETVNESGNYTPEIKNRSNRANSDHFHFTTKNIPAFFVYARGEVGGYHNLGDTVEKLETGQFEGLFNLFKEFVKSL